ncbi:MAG: FkbM family methyltransferase [Candidatus Absconditabacteria bacterium]|nr:FkbM family methyltransferase [Candidatus Absconditabacteria bacterium]
MKYFFKVKSKFKTKKMKIDNFSIEIPNSVHAFGVIIEIFMINLYKELSGGKCVLDIGGFIGESALYLSKYNQKVIVYESNTEHYKILKENCKNIKNIKAFNGAISAQRKDLYQNDRDIIDSCNQISESGDTKIAVFTIQNIVKQHNPDILKMDIEGGEYDIIKYRIKSGIFEFKKGIIEFHFFEGSKEKNIELFQRFLDFLNNKHYQYNLFNNVKRKVSIDNIIRCKEIACNLYFYK